MLKKSIKKHFPQNSHFSKLEISTFGKRALKAISRPTDRPYGLPREKMDFAQNDQKMILSTQNFRKHKSSPPFIIIYDFAQKVAQKCTFLKIRAFQIYLLFKGITGTSYFRCTAGRPACRARESISPKMTKMILSIQNFRKHENSPSFIIIYDFVTLSSKFALFKTRNLNFWQTRTQNFLMAELRLHSTCEHQATKNSHVALHWFIPLCTLEPLSRAVVSKRRVSTP